MKSNNNENGVTDMNSESTNPNNIKAECYRELLQYNRPYYFYITFWFYKGVTLQNICMFVSHFIRVYNQLLFGNNNDSEDNYLDGFFLIEQPLIHAEKLKLVTHLLIKHNREYSKITRDEHTDIWDKATKESNFWEPSNRRIYRVCCASFSYIGDTITYKRREEEICGIDHYCIVPISKDGILDYNDDNFMLLLKLLDNELLLTDEELVVE
jgi:hypothetical protein